LSLPDLSGDLDSQFRCLRQVQYHLEYLFDGFLQSVLKASSADMFHIPAHSILFNKDSGLPRLLLPSSAKSNGWNTSPVFCSQSTECVSQHLQNENPLDRTCQQNVSLPSGTNFSPSSPYADSEVSSVSWCYSSEDSAEMHGSGTDMHFSIKRCDIHKEQLASTRENGKTQSNQPVRFESNHSSGTGARFVSHREQVALDARTKELAIGQALKIQGYIRSDRKIVEKLNYHTQKKFVRHEDEARHVPKYCQDLCSSKSFLQKQYDTDMESTRAPSAMNQMPKHQSFNIPNTTECAGASLCKNLPIKQSFGTSKEHEIFDWPTKQRPICKPLNLENRRSGWDCSKKISAGKQIVITTKSTCLL